MLPIKLKVHFKGVKYMKKLILSLLVVMLLSVFTVSAASNITVGTVTVTPTSADPGKEITFSVDITNNGSTPIAKLGLKTTDPSYGANKITAPTISDVTNLLNKTKQIATWKLTIPSTAATGTYNGIFTVTEGNTTVDTKSYSFSVNSYTTFSATNSVSAIVQKGGKVSKTFTVTNTGNTKTSLTLLAASIKDNDGSELKVNLSTKEVKDLIAGASKTITVDFIADDSMDLGEYTGKIEVKSGSLTKNVSLAVEVEPEICESGKIGNLQVDLEDPDSGDSYDLGEKIEVTVDVDNDDDDDMKVIVSAYLYDLTDGKLRASVKSDSTTIEESDEKEFSLYLTVPSTSKMDASNTHYLYVKACKKGDEDEHCDYERIKIDIERKDDDVIITKFTVSPTVGLKAGDSINVNVAVENIGEDDQDDSYIKVKSSALGIDKKSTVFDLDDYNDDDNTYSEQFLVQIPKTAKTGTYWLEAFTYYDDGDEHKSKLLKISVTGTDDSTKKDNSTKKENAKSTPGQAKLTVTKTAVKLKSGQKKWVIPVTIENSGKSVLKLKLDATEVSSWAKVLSVEAPSELFAGEKYYAYVYLELKDNVIAGAHNLRVNVRDASGLLQSKLLTVTVPAKDTATTDKVTGSVVKKVFSDKARVFWIIGDILLLIIAIFFIRMLFKK